MTTETKVEAVAADELAEHLGFNIELIPSVQREAIESEVAVVLKVADRFHQSALDALRGEVERKSVLLDQFMDKWAAEIRRADAAGRRVAELEAAILSARAGIDHVIHGALPEGRLGVIHDRLTDALTKESP